MKRGNYKWTLVLVLSLVLILVVSLYINELFGLTGMVTGVSNTCYFADSDGDCLISSNDLMYARELSLLRSPGGCAITVDGVEVCDKTLDVTGDGVVDSSDVGFIKDMSLLKKIPPGQLKGVPGSIQKISPNYIDGTSPYTAKLRVLNKMGNPSVMMGVTIGQETKFTDLNGEVEFDVPDGNNNLNAYIPEDNTKAVSGVSQSFCVPICNNLNNLLCGGEADGCGGICPERDTLKMYLEDQQVDDDFTGTVIDTSKWNVGTYGDEGFSVTQDNKLMMSKPESATAGLHRAHISSINKFSLTGDFDIQVDFNLINFPAGNASSANQAQLALYDPLTTTWWLNRIKGWDIADGYSTLRSDTNSEWGRSLGTGTDTGKLRLTRIGSTLNAYYYNIVSNEWKSIGGTTISQNPINVIIYARNNNRKDALSVEWDNFLVYKKNIGDSSGNNNNGVSYGAMQTDGNVGRALNFDGGKDYIEIPYTASLAVGNRFSTGFWFKSNALLPVSEGVFISHIGRYGAGSNGWQVSYTPGNYINFMFRNLNGDQVHSVNGLLNTDQWYYLTAVYSDDGTSATTKIYLNGALLDTKTHINQIMNGVPNEKMYIGTNIDGAPNTGSKREINGIMDEIVVYYKDLTDAQVLESYQSSGSGHLCNI